MLIHIVNNTLSHVLNDEQRREIYENFLFVRQFEGTVLEAYESGGVPELPHVNYLTSLVEILSR
jgi:TPP-dependent pyruvate/acetoin dehydrogenase alpha subunit